MELGIMRSSVGRLAVKAKDLYKGLSLTTWTILRVRHVAAAIAHTDVELVIDGGTYRTDLRWFALMMREVSQPNGSPAGGCFGFAATPTS
jgi:hypothetical protein